MASSSGCAPRRAGPSSGGAERKAGSASPPEAPHPDQRFPRSSRLTARRQYVAVYEKGRRVSSPHFTLFGLPTEASASRLGITVTRRYGGAAERNRAKRILREIFRRNRERLRPPLDLVVNVRSGLAAEPFDRLEREFVRQFVRLARRFQP